VAYVKLPPAVTLGVRVRFRVVYQRSRRSLHKLFLGTLENLP